MFWSSLAVAGALVGPPKLPPMPGQSAPPSPDAEATDPPPQNAKLPGAPTSKPKAVTPAPASPAPTTPTPTPPTATPAQPPPTETKPGGFRLPDAEPPQPEPIAKPPAGDSPSARPPRGGEGASPSMGPPPPLPGDDASPTRPKLPPPARPPHRGIGLFVGAGVAFSVALAQQIAAHVIVKRRCIEPVAEQSAMTDPFDSDTDAEEVGNAIIECVPGVLPVVALRVNSDLALVATVAMATAGAVLRAERDAYDHAFASRTNRRVPALRGAGIGLVAAGALTWLTLGPASWGVLAKCDDAKCAARARAMSFITRDVGVAMAAAGAAMLGYSESYRRRHEQYSRERALLWAPVVGRGFAGLSLAQRF